MKLIKKFRLVSLISLAVASVSIVAGTTSVLLVKGGEVSSAFDNNISNSINESPTNDLTNNNQTIKPLIPSASNFFNAKLSSPNGPILFWDTKITGAD